jgi:ferredoxin
MIFHKHSGRHTRTEYIQVDTRKCESCGECVAACKNGVLKIMDIRIHSHVRIRQAEKCRGCKKCVAACPNGAFTPVPKKSVSA